MLKHPTSRFFASRRGIAAIEFALIAPLFGLMIIGVFDTAKAIVLWEQVQNTAHLVAVSATTVSTINSDKSTTITGAAAQQSMSIIYAEMPWVRDLIEQGQRSVTLTAVEFTAVTTACTQVTGQNCNIATVVWSVPYAGGQAANASQFQAVVRPCGTLTQITPQATIPAGLTQLGVLRTANVSIPDAIMVADVHYRYSPLFFKFITGPIDFWVTFDWPARSGGTTLPPGKQYTSYSGSGGTGTCPNIP